MPQENTEDLNIQENKKAVAWLTLGHGVVDSYSGFINPILPFIVANIGTTLAAATCALSASQLFSSMMQPVFGFVLLYAVRPPVFQQIRQTTVPPIGYLTESAAVYLTISIFDSTLNSEISNIDKWR